MVREGRGDDQVDSVMDCPEVPADMFLRFWRLGKVFERDMWILSWTALRSLLIFFGFLEVGEGGRKGQVDSVVD